MPLQVKKLLSRQKQSTTKKIVQLKQYFQIEITLSQKMYIQKCQSRGIKFLVQMYNYILNQFGYVYKHLKTMDTKLQSIKCSASNHLVRQNEWASVILVCMHSSTDIMQGRLDISSIYVIRQFWQLYARCTVHTSKNNTCPFVLPYQITLVPLSIFPMTSMKSTKINQNLQNLNLL